MNTDAESKKNIVNWVKEYMKMTAYQTKCHLSVECRVGFTFEN